VVSSVAKRAELNRSTTYVILDSLSKQGLVSISKRGKIQVFTPATPEKLVQIAEDKAKHYESLAELGKTLITELALADEQIASKPKIQIFNGIESIKNVFEEILDSKTKHIFVYNKPLLPTSDSFVTKLIEFYSNLEGKFSVSALSDNTPENRNIFINSDSTDSSQSLIKTTDSFDSDLIIFNNKVAFISRAEKSAYIIENSEFGTAIRNLFIISKENSSPWKVKDVEKEIGAKTKSKQPALVKAEKRFWKI